ncbi:uncharacterized protein LOC120671852 isoform X2 [Panicum virgatum]|uniref:uncharacterized protein LOC120671852 isoform X2 n=1 Tax=Panicum virgatum TaxID=38727 RepID=UPI0019D5A913|nr:uncharacterized protein LOC120671852 isoform X2 [Panicum virgatum]
MSESSPSSVKLGMVDFDYERSVLEEWAQAAESEDGDDSFWVPPVSLIRYRDLLKRAWGWERLLPRLNGSIDWDQYKTYLEEYYQHNADKAASKETLRAAANLCISVEQELVGYCICIFNMEDMRMCSQIQERVTVVLNSEGEYPAAAAALPVY